MAVSNQYLLGYDLRLPLTATDWDAQFRDVFLLRPEIAAPASVDPMIWPSVFRYGPLSPTPAVAARQGAIEIEPTGFEHGVMDLWPELDAMMVCFDQHRLDIPVVPVAVVLHGEDAKIRVDHQVAILDKERLRAPPPDGWTLLGYDVADSGFTGGLSNCGYDAAEKPDWQRTWSPWLNDYGLFTTFEDSTAFAAASDARVPEHAPFFVYTLHADPAALWQALATA